MSTLYIVMPAYNEEANIRPVVEGWYPCLDMADEASRLVIADSGSKDGTHGILMDMKADGYPKLEILSETGQYHGPKLMALYDYAIKNGADYIFQTDSDGQTDPSEFGDFYGRREKYDGIFGVRRNRGDGASRAFVEKVVCLLVRLIFGVKVPDANAPFRLMKTDVVSKYLHLLRDDYNLPNIMMVVYFNYYNEKCAFRDISFKPRQGGKNSINIPRIIKIGIEAMGEFIALRKNMPARK